MICRKVLRDFEKELREEYDKVLSEKLKEQYEAFAKFSQDQIRRQHDAITPSCKFSFYCFQNGNFFFKKIVVTLKKFLKLF